MGFNGSEGGEITLSSAAAMTKEFRLRNPESIKARFFGKDIINKILNQEGCMGIRFYYGLDEDGNNQLVMVGADSDENDITDLVADLSHPCPDTCSFPNSLNS